MGIGKSIQRVDARAKVTGQAKYTQDLMTQPMMVAKAKKMMDTARNAPPKGPNTLSKVFWVRVTPVISGFSHSPQDSTASAVMVQTTSVSANTSKAPQSPCRAG